MEEGLGRGVVILGRSFRYSEFSNVVGEVQNKCELRIFREDFVHSLYVAESSINIIGNRLSSLLI